MNSLAAATLCLSDGRERQPNATRAGPHPTISRELGHEREQITVVNLGR